MGLAQGVMLASLDHLRLGVRVVEGLLGHSTHVLLARMLLIVVNL